MRRFEVTFEVDAPARRVWRMLHPRPPHEATHPRRVDYPKGHMDILVEGDENGQGLVRTCEFAVPTWLGSGGVAHSWEVVTDVRPGEYARYEGVCKPLWAQMSGWHEVTAIDDEHTRLTFVENYHAVNPVLRRLFEARVHRFISDDNVAVYTSIMGYLGPVRRISKEN